MSTADTSGSAQATGSPLDFLLVGADYNLLKTVTSAVRRVTGQLHCAVSAAAGTEYVKRRKLDAIVIDMDLPGSDDMIGEVRQGASNKNAVVFACTASVPQRTAALHAGANFVLPKPVTADSAGAAFVAAQGMMVRERRRYFRHPVALTVFLEAGGHEQKLSTVNVSEGGMALRAFRPIERGTLVAFRLVLPSNIEVSGKAEVAWSNTEGIMGIRFHFLKDKGQAVLSSWLDGREKLAGVTVVH